MCLHIMKFFMVITVRLAMAKNDHVSHIIKYDVLNFAIPSIGNAIYLFIVEVECAHYISKITY